LSRTSGDSDEKLVWRGHVVGDHPEALVHEEHQRSVELEEQFDIQWGEKHVSSPVCGHR
jgi:hypothetical protein